ncbi:hypothetical protein BL250_15240 [Erwinia sp. OLTSP20]|uniref:hypothetical protein n=1 Tax=unclassified Erwinia TaxID=2622719 RepID=UPI000C1892CF|nr:MULTISPECIES: hypothetical protein [unclassified Erwinia]PIJ51727.1 hypothetical protein BV501_03300 [Erwinia sp. OAMSP11]PIJ75614.1 hypothetical protein BK416_01595 [Erwinia sp. OLSSP12]PIJ84919.1 hypothetical protein BLD47_01525 [Erwinia sp. OLCASP19]PIJ86698.1 hypothetical protein BLD46_03125 [Erwinia sp. OLMTSP26]PIJ88139.1 hypothetical protein BLD49_03805 [Erwinia sp. OLMDSP33]
MCNIIIENDIKLLFRADSRSPEVIKKIGGFSQSLSIDTDGTLGRFQNNKAIEPIIYVAETFGGMRRFAEKMPGERYYYQINSEGLNVARYRKNCETTLGRRNLALHLKTQKVLMNKVIGEGWEKMSDKDIRIVLTKGRHGEVSWFDLTTNVDECHIIGSVSQLHNTTLPYAYDSYPIIVGTDRIVYVGNKSTGKSPDPEKLG